MNSSNHGYIWFEKLECQRGQKRRSRKFNNIWRRALCSVTLSNSLLSCSLLWQKLGKHPGRQTSKTVKTRNQRSLTNLLISHILAHFCHMYFSDSLLCISLILQCVFLLCNILWTCPKQWRQGISKVWQISSSVSLAHRRPYLSNCSEQIHTDQSNQAHLVN